MSHLFGLPLSFLFAAWGLALLISALGFLRSDWFISIGYGLSVSGLALLSALWFRNDFQWGAGIQLALLCAYGIRLSMHLILRERRPSYQAELEASRARSARIRGGVKFAIWLSVSALYVAMAWPGAVSAASGDMGLFGVFGLVVMALGLFIEMTADQQKTIAKSAAPGDFVHEGLYSRVRYPNYFGEMLFWLGNFLAALLLHGSWLSFALALAGLVCIWLIMLGSARRLELKQEERYGNIPEYHEYITEVPVLFPWVPLYSLKRLRVYLG